MKSTRRQFIRYVGAMLASLVSTSCQASCYKPESTQLIPTLSDVPPALNPAWVALRQCWLDLDDPQLQSFEDNEFTLALRRRHAGALAKLVQEEVLEAAVADEISVAFEEAVAHVQRQMATCYEALPPEFVPRDDLTRQAALLEEMADASGIAPETVAQAQAALERDMTWLRQFNNGQIPGELEDVQASPAAIKAARVLVDLLLGKTGETQ